MRVRLKRGLKREKFLGGTGMLESKQYDDADGEYTGFALCNDELQRFFDIPLTVMEIDLVLSTRSNKDSYEVQQENNDHILVECESVWVDDELATLVGEYEYDGSGGNVRRAYLSFEYPKGV